MDLEFRWVDFLFVRLRARRDRSRPTDDMAGMKMTHVNSFND